MAWTNSKIFQQTLADALANTTALQVVADTINVALYNNSITPDRTVSAANTAYNAGVWANTNEVSSAGQWAAGGVALASKTLTPSAGTVPYAAANTASGGTATLASVYGCLVYDNTLASPVAKQGICFNYFGGSNSVTSGTFTVVWNASGIFAFTV